MSKRNKRITLLAAIVLLALTAAVFLGKLSGTEYSAALTGLGAFILLLVGIDKRKTKASE